MLKEYLEVAKIHIKRADDGIKFLSNIKLDNQSFNDINTITIIDAFIFRFIKLQDHLGKNFFPVLLAKIDVSQDNMPLIDVLDRLEKIGLLSDSERWMDYRDVRNRITHEYPEDKTNIIQTIEDAMVYFKEIKQAVKHLETYISKHKL